MTKLFFAALCCVALTSCSSSSSTSDNSEGTTDSGNGTANTVLTGVFLDSAVEGISYATETLSGVTNQSGEFQYLSGESVTFSIGDLAFPTILAAEVVTPLSMSTNSSVSDNVVVNTAMLLQSLDVDGDPSNGITISDEAAASASAVDLTENPDELSQNSDVINLIANSGSSDTEIVSSENAVLHLQSTLIDSGALESLDKLEYTNLMVGNTAEWSSGQNIYYQPGGVKFVQRIEGEEFLRSWYLDDAGLLCETIRDESVFCIADADSFLMTRSPGSNVYNYNGVSFFGTIAISEGDSLGLSESGSAGAPDIVGTWDITYAEGCVEKFTYNADGTINSIDFEEIQTGTYVLSEQPIDKNRYSLETTILTDNQLPGCDGETESSAGRVFSFFAEIESNIIRFYSSVDAENTIFVMTR